jgi:glycosyltransferase involved in cell wall biosynthesis
MRRHVLFIVENNSALHDRRVVAEMLAVRELGYEVSVISPRDKSRRDGGDDRALVDGVRVFSHPRVIEGEGVVGLLLEYLIAFVWELLLSARIFVAHPFQVIHAANPPDYLFLIGVVYKMFGVRFIFDHHDIAPETFEAKFGRVGWVTSFLLLMEGLSFRTADVVISTNESYREIAMCRGRKLPADVFVVRNGPDLSQIAVRPASSKLREGWAYLVGYVGVIGRQEGLENLLKAAEYIVKEKGRSDIRFIVVGTGTYLKVVRQLCRDSGLERYFWFTGFIPDDVLYEILSTVDICVNPEFRNEFTDKSTMIKIMEYMAFSKPIVQFYTREGAVSAGAASMYVRENSVVLFAEEILSLLADEVRRKEMGAVGRQRIEQDLCWNKQKGALRRAYERAVER